MEENKKIFGEAPIPELALEKTPQEVLNENYTWQQWPVSGGWGYTQEDAMLIELDNEAEGVHLEYELLQARAYLEAKYSRSEEIRLRIVRVQNGTQWLTTGDDGKHYDKIEMFIIARDEVSGKLVKYRELIWFDINRFFGKD